MMISLKNQAIDLKNDFDCFVTLWCTGAAGQTWTNRKVERAVPSTHIGRAGCSQGCAIPLIADLRIPPPEGPGRASGSLDHWQAWARRAP